MNHYKFDSVFQVLDASAQMLTFDIQKAKAKLCNL